MYRKKNTAYVEFDTLHGFRQPLRGLDRVPCGEGETAVGCVCRNWPAPSTSSPTQGAVHRREGQVLMRKECLLFPGVMVVWQSSYLALRKKRGQQQCEEMLEAGRIVLWTFPSPLHFSSSLDMCFLLVGGQGPCVFCGLELVCRSPYSLSCFKSHSVESSLSDQILNCLAVFFSFSLEKQQEEYFGQKWERADNWSSCRELVKELQFQLRVMKSEGGCYKDEEELKC